MLQTIAMKLIAMSHQTPKILGCWNQWAKKFRIGIKSNLSDNYRYTLELNIKKKKSTTRDQELKKSGKEGI